MFNVCNVLEHVFSWVSKARAICVHDSENQLKARYTDGAFSCFQLLCTDGSSGCDCGICN